MKTTKRLILTLALILAPLMMVAAQGAAGQKIAIVDSQNLLTSMPEAKAMQTELDALMKKYEDTLVKLREELNSKYQAYIAEQDTLLETIKVRREQELEDLAKRIEELGRVAQEDIQKKQMELFAPIQTKLRDAINKVGEENGYTYIMDATSILYLNNASAIDATAQVRAKLGI
ncbi:MAG: OmpH family outer membrane protein [Porphyromonas sp.]|nr:OmpH family outer membrane protein [Porphyromonas sp.]